MAGASKYGIEIEDDSGRRVFGVQTGASEVMVPDGVLEPGVAYQWTVRTLDLFGATARGAGLFSTLSSEDERDREALRRSLEAEGGRAHLRSWRRLTSALAFMRKHWKDFARR